MIWPGVMRRVQASPVITYSCSNNHNKVSRPFVLIYVIEDCLFGARPRPPQESPGAGGRGARAPSKLHCPSRFLCTTITDTQEDGHLRVL